MSLKTQKKLLRYIALTIALVFVFLIVKPICATSSHNHESMNNRNVECLLGCNLTQGSVQSHQNTLGQILNSFNAFYSYIILAIISLLLAGFIFSVKPADDVGYFYLSEWLRRGLLHPKIY